MMASITFFFKKLKPEQRNRLLLTAVGTLMAVVGLYFVLIREQMDSLQVEKDAASQCEDKLKEARRLLKMAASYEAELRDTTARLAAIEATLAPPNSDLYAWMIKLLMQFKEDRKVDILHVSRESLVDAGTLPVFPYQAIQTTVNGLGQYHEIGRFLADFENRYPYFRVQNLELRPATGSQSPEDREKLEFKMELVALAAKSPPPH